MYSDIQDSFTDEHVGYLFNWLYVHMIDEV